MNQPLKIAVAGLGTVGAGAVKALLAHKDALSARAGRSLDVTLLCDRNPACFTPFAGIKTTDDLKALVASDVDVVVELIGGENGIAPALVENALRAGKHVVTANKAMMARHGARLAALAEENGVGLRFEAAVAGGIPILKSLRESLFVYGVSAVRGILNGTCNYILTQMDETGRSFADVLK
ncbi:MAG: homoserine dehydrogenase, partial [Rhizomicrobium sp.]